MIPLARALGLPGRGAARAGPSSGPLPDGPVDAATSWARSAASSRATVALLPLVTHRETIAVLFGDNPETRARPPAASTALEVFVHQAGIALENAFLQRKLQTLGGDGPGRRSADRIRPRSRCPCRADDPSRKGQDFLQIVTKAKEFTEELLKENERLRFKIAALEAAGGARPRRRARARSCSSRIRELEERLAEMEARYRKVEEENKEFADRYIEIEEQNNNLANLYVASYQLHSTLDYKEVVRIVQEIVINLIGAEVFHLFMVSEKTGALELETSEGQDAGTHRDPDRARAPIGKAAQTGENYFAENGGPARAHALRRAHRRHPPQDQGQRDRRDLDQQAARPEDRLHHHGLRALHAARRPRRHRDLLGQALLRPPPGSSRRCRASWTC